MNDQESPLPAVDRDPALDRLRAEVEQLRERIDLLEQSSAAAERRPGSPLVIQPGVPGRNLVVRLGALLLFGVFVAVTVVSATVLVSQSPGNVVGYTPSAGARGLGATPTAAPTERAVQATATLLASTATRVFGPFSGKLISGADKEIPIKATHLHVRDFIAEARFTNPYDPGSIGWDYGFIFRSTGLDQQYRLYVTSGGEWALKLVNLGTPPPTPGDSVSSSDMTDIGGGVVDDLDTSTGGSNLLRLVVKDGTGYFFVNGRYVDTLDVSDKVEKGFVEAGTAFLVSDHKPGSTTAYTDFSVWEIR